MGTDDVIDPDARLFFEGLVQDCLTVPDGVRRLLDLEPDLSELSAAARGLAARLFEEHAAEFSELLVAAALRVAWGVSAHLAGATWISNDGRPVMLVASTDLGGDICDDYMMEFAQVLDEVREQFERGERQPR